MFCRFKAVEGGATKISSSFSNDDQQQSMKIQIKKNISLLPQFLAAVELFFFLPVCGAIPPIPFHVSERFQSSFKTSHICNIISH